MSWNYLLGSAIGTSHIRSGMRCQDEVGVCVQQAADGQDVLAIFVCDGAGSAPHGGTGAELAVQASLDFVQQRVASPEFDLDDVLGRELLEAARGAIDSRATQVLNTVRDFACTYLALISADSFGTLVVQIGDGGIAVELGDGLICLTEPMNGEYANSTRFLTEDDYLEVAQIRHASARADRAALFTDGLQSLGVEQVGNTPHVPFFEPFFKALESVDLPENDDHPLQGALSRFLQSDQVNARTDDDKSLALAVWMPSVDLALVVGEG